MPPNRRTADWQWSIRHSSEMPSNRHSDTPEFRLKFCGILCHVRFVYTHKRGRWKLNSLYVLCDFDWQMTFDELIFFSQGRKPKSRLCHKQPRAYKDRYDVLSGGCRPFCSEPDRENRKTRSLEFWTRDGNANAPTVCWSSKHPVTVCLNAGTL